MMESIIASLREVTTPESVDECMNEIQKCDAAEITEHSSVISELLTAITSNENLKLNAKQRRKAKRLIQTLTAPVATDSSESISSSGLERDAYTDSVAAQFQSVKTAQDVEGAVVAIEMDKIPAGSGSIAGLISTLESVVENVELNLNSKQRRRVKRLIESLTALQAPPSEDAGATDVAVTPVEKVSNEETIQLLNRAGRVYDVECALNSMQLPDMKHIETLPADSQEVRTVKELESTLLRLISSNLTNKKLRHRMKKALYILSGGVTPQLPAREVEPKKSRKEDSTKRTVHDIHPSSVKSNNPMDSVITSLPSPSSLLQALNTATSSPEVLEALNSVPALPEVLVEYLRGDGDCTAPLLAALNRLSKGEGITLTAKAKRKTSRVLEALSGALALGETGNGSTSVEPDISGATPNAKDTKVTIAVSTEDDTAESKKRKKNDKKCIEKEKVCVEEEAQRLSSAALEEAAKALRRAKSSGEVEAALVGIGTGGDGGVGGNCKARRTIKRALELVLNEEHGSVSLSSNARRKVKRALLGVEAAGDKSLAEQWKTSKKRANSIDSSCSTQDGSKRLRSNSECTTSSNGGEDSNETRTKPKYRLFFGQLSYSTTAEDVERHITTSGATCKTAVRLLTDKDTGASRGSAFVDVFGGKRSLKKLMSLHHTQLNGRRINVEFTARRGAGPGDSEMTSLKLKQTRMAQKIKDSEAVDAVLGEYASLGLGAKGGIIQDDSLMNRLYAMNVNEVRDVMESCKRVIGTQGGGLEVLRRELYKHDKGGHDVDQSKAKGYKWSGKKRPAESEQPYAPDTDQVPWGYSGPPETDKDDSVCDTKRSKSSTVISDERSRIQSVFRSLKGRGGKLLANRS
mmetsp:Transcript_784/g.1301  ORF Transcript_784/g.1301 Transcript_784/m.1301 type:complete len:862 (+) Transcript_784:18-2603(+)